MSQTSDAVETLNDSTRPSIVESPKRVVVDGVHKPAKRRRFVIVRRKPTEPEHGKYQAVPTLEETSAPAPTTSDIPRVLPTIGWMVLVSGAARIHPFAFAVVIATTAFVSAVQRAKDESGNVNTRRRIAVAMFALLLPLLAFSSVVLAIAAAAVVISSIALSSVHLRKNLVKPWVASMVLYSLCACSLTLLAFQYGRSYAMSVIVLAFAYDVGHRLFAAPHASRWEPAFAGWLTVLMIGVCIADVVGTTKTSEVWAFVLTVCLGAVFAAQLRSRLKFSVVSAPLAAYRLDSLLIATPVCLLLHVLKV